MCALQDKKDHILAEGVTVKKGARALQDDVASDTVDLKKEVAEQKMRQMYGQLELEEFDEINDTHQGILTCQSYLREERPEELWDCESIISTYSTLDNHPSVIKVRQFSNRMHACSMHVCIINMTGKRNQELRVCRNFTQTDPDHSTSFFFIPF